MSRYPGQGFYTIVTAALAALCSVMSAVFESRFGWAMTALSWLSTAMAWFAKDIALFLASPPKIDVPGAIYSIATIAMLIALGGIVLWMSFG